MQTYRPVQVDNGRWAVERLVDGKSQGFALGTCTNEAEARFMAYEIARRRAQSAPWQPARPIAAVRKDAKIRARSAGGG